MEYLNKILPNLVSSFYLMIIGMSIVFGVLILFSLIIWIMQKIDYKFSKLPRATYTEKDIVVENVNLKKDDYRELIAVITAAIAAVDTKHRYIVKKIRFIKEKPRNWVSSGWSELLGHNKTKRN